jgi:hypothetical protein
MTKDTLIIFLLVVFCKIIFSENNTSMNMPRGNVSLQRYLHLPNHLIIYYRLGRLDYHSILGMHQKFTILSQVPTKLVRPLRQMNKT